jgi:lysophospholipase L1-like esterase
MAETQPKSPHAPLVLILVTIANILLFFGVISTRANRIAFSDVPFFTGEFVALLGITMVLIVASFWGFSQARMLHRLQQSPLLAIGLCIVTAIGIFVPTWVLDFWSIYNAPFVLWGFIIILSIAYIVFLPRLQHLNLKPILTPLTQLFVGLLILFFIVEGGMRLWFTFLGSPTDKANYLYPVDHVLNLYNRFNGQPYVNFGLSPNHPDHNSRGYRGDELITPKPDGVFRIFAIGGSTTYGVSLKNNETYPALLQAILQERGYSNIEVINAGVPQYATYVNLVNFEFRLLDDQPDMILTYEGINDVVTRLVDPSRYNGLNAMRGIWNTSYIQQSPFVAVRFFSQRLGFATPISSLDSALFNVADVIRCTDPQFCQALDLSPQQVLEANPPTYFERNLRNMIAIARVNSVQFVFSTWAYFPEASNGSLYMTYLHMQYGVAQHNDLTRQLAQELDIPMIDLASTMPYGAQYWQDGLHLTAEGTLAQATQYADFLINNNLLPKP